MKKLLVVLLALLLALGGVAAMAAEEYAEPIRFLGLEWGAAMPDLQWPEDVATGGMTAWTTPHSRAYFLWMEEDPVDDYPEMIMTIKNLSYIDSVAGRGASTSL